MRKYLYAFLMVSIIGCISRSEKNETTAHQLPENYYGIVHLPSEYTYPSYSKKNSIALLNELEHFLVVVDTLTNDSISYDKTIGLYSQGDQTAFFMITDKNVQTNFPKSELMYSSTSYTKIEVIDQDLYITQEKGMTSISNSSLLTEQYLRQTKKPNIQNPVEQLLHQIQQEEEPHILLNFERGRKAFTNLLPSELPQPLAHWGKLSLNNLGKTIQTSGIAIDMDTLATLNKYLQKTGHGTLSAAKFAPSEIEQIQCYTIHDWDQYQSNIRVYGGDMAQTKNPFSLINEICKYGLPSGQAVSISTDNPAELKLWFEENTMGSSAEEFFKSLKTESTASISSFLSPIFPRTDALWVLLLENSLFFAKEQQPLEDILNTTRSGQNFFNSSLYHSIKDHMTEEATYWQISNNLSNSTEPKAYLFQASEEDGYLHLNIAEKPMKEKLGSIGVAPLFTVTTNDLIANKPQFLKNHISGGYDIAVQDMSNVLYLISKKGEILWQKALNSPIQGKIQQVDLFKNGKLQLAFCTTSEFIIMDRNGNLVEPFNFKYDQGKLLPIAVFDYENNRDYRFVVVSGPNIYMYNNEGKIVNGFTFTKSNTPITQTPTHLRIANKDYLVFVEKNGKVNILNRIGKERINSKINLTSILGSPRVYKNKITLVEKEGIMHQWDTQGNVKTTAIATENMVGWDATSKSLTHLSENKLKIKGKETILDFGAYTAPQIFYEQDKLYFSTTNLETESVYLFDSQSNILKGFPTKGQSSIDIADMNGDGTLEMVTQDRSNAIKVYTFRP